MNPWTVLALGFGGLFLLFFLGWMIAGLLEIIDALREW